MSFENPIWSALLTLTQVFFCLKFCFFSFVRFVCDAKNIICVISRRKKKRLKISSKNTFLIWQERSSKRSSFFRTTRGWCIAFKQAEARSTMRQKPDYGATNLQISFEEWKKSIFSIFICMIATSILQFTLSVQINTNNHVSIQRFISATVVHFIHFNLSKLKKNL